MNITHIRFYCAKHNKPLMNCGSGRVFSPTYTTVEEARGQMDGFALRQDENGWLALDTSELVCPHMASQFEQDVDPDMIDYCHDHWVIEGK